MADRSRAEAVKARVEDELLTRTGVTGVATGPKIAGGTDTDTWSIRVYVENKRDVPPEERLPSEIEGVPVDVVERRFVPHPGVTVAEERQND